MDFVKKTIMRTSAARTLSIVAKLSLLFIHAKTCNFISDVLKIEGRNAIYHDFDTTQRHTFLDICQIIILRDALCTPLY